MADAISESQPPMSVPAPKPAKYRNVKSGGFDSIKERDIWPQLELRAKAGDIANLKRQVPYALVVNGVLVARYIADFVFDEGRRRVVWDAKSPPTRKLESYRMKVKLMLACHNLQVEEV